MRLKLAVYAAFLSPPGIIYKTDFRRPFCYRQKRRRLVRRHRNTPHYSLQWRFSWQRSWVRALNFLRDRRGLALCRAYSARRQTRRSWHEMGDSGGRRKSSGSSGRSSGGEKGRRRTSGLPPAGQHQSAHRHPSTDDAGAVGGGGSVDYEDAFYDDAPDMTTSRNQRRRVSAAFSPFQMMV